MHLYRSLLFWTLKHINIRLKCISADYYRYKTYMITFYILSVSADFLLRITEIHVHILNTIFCFERSTFPPNTKFTYFYKYASNAFSMLCNPLLISGLPLFYVLGERKRERKWSSPWGNSAYETWLFTMLIFMWLRTKYMSNLGMF